MEFVYDAVPARVLFGPGRAGDVAAELARENAGRVLVACTANGQRRYRDQIDALGDLCIGVFAGAEPHCPEPVAQAALAQFKESGADAVLTIGGGSTIGIGKYIAAHSDAVFVAVPTTASGSEMTPLYGVKVGHEKRTSRDVRALPKSVIYDPLLSLSLPARETATIGMNCLAHCVEALYPREPNPIAFLIAKEGIGALIRGLPAACADLQDLEARTQVMYGGFLGGLLVSMVGIALHHKICHVLGGRFGVPHSECNAVILPHAIAYNAPAVPAAVAALSELFGTNDAAGAVFDFAGVLDVPVGLQALGVSEGDLDACAGEIASATFYNPRPVDPDGMRRLLSDAYRAHRPVALEPEAI
ncbi:MAG: maleylacetate reductase [Sphingomonadales bacterium]|nr:maleylacetate reductase [Sphingomonadales bacterium]